LTSAFTAKDTKITKFIGTKTPIFVSFVTFVVNWIFLTNVCDEGELDVSARPF
jgi:hypothetical protein